MPARCWGPRLHAAAARRCQPAHLHVAGVVAAPLCGALLPGPHGSRADQTLPQRRVAHRAAPQQAAKQAYGPGRHCCWCSDCGGRRAAPQQHYAARSECGRWITAARQKVNGRELVGWRDFFRLQLGQCMKRMVVRAPRSQPPGLSEPPACARSGPSTCCWRASAPATARSLCAGTLCTARPPGACKVCVQHWHGHCTHPYAHATCAAAAAAAFAPAGRSTSTPASATPAMEKVTFGAGLPGYEVGPKTSPAVIVLQEWWGE